ncbi:MAG: hypothetical protein VB959_22240, partial [Rhodospirillales bacterium]
MSGFIFVYIISTGLAVWLPKISQDGHSWFGVRFMVSVFLVPIILYTGNVLLNIPLSFVGWAALTAAVAGLVFGAVLEKRRSVGLKFIFGGSLH